MIITIIGLAAVAGVLAWIMWREVGMDVFRCPTCGRDTWHKRHRGLDKWHWQCLNCKTWSEKKRVRRRTDTEPERTN